MSAVEDIYIHPQWDNNPADYNHDLAIIKLAQPFAQTSGYALYRAKTEIGQTFTRVGFSGSDLVAGKNTYDALTDIINNLFESRIEAGSQLLYDYDDGTTQHDALGGLFNLPNLGLGSDETMSQSGLSGGGTFIDGKIAGIGSFIFSSALTDVNSVTDSSVGEMGSDTRISTHADWIDFVTQGNPIYTPPTLASDVIKNVLLMQDISFHFRTINGTDIANKDYIATQRQMTIHTGENHVAIPVTILGDKITEANETFSLEISEAIGFSLPNNALVLIATHTIIDNDTAIL